MEILRLFSEAYQILSSVPSQSSWKTCSKRLLCCRQDGIVMASDTVSDTIEIQDENRFNLCPTTFNFLSIFPRIEMGWINLEFRKGFDNWKSGGENISNKNNTFWRWPFNLINEQGLCSKLFIDILQSQTFMLIRFSIMKISSEVASCKSKNPHQMTTYWTVAESSELVPSICPLH